MSNKKRLVVVFAIMVTLPLALPAAEKEGKKVRESDVEITRSEDPVLWRYPDDIRSRNLFYGPGGPEHAPHTIHTFEKEDMDGTSPKFIVRDENGVRWKVKMGPEARPETVASRLVWAVGYFTNEDYFLPDLRVEDMPPHLHRGQNFVESEGTVRNVRLKRYLQDEKKLGDWRWTDNPFAGTRRLSGLKVMMALINNWDLKDENNSIYHEKRSDVFPITEDLYMVSDLGASFGTTGLGWTKNISKGNFNSYSLSKFISRVTPQYVDFNVPTRASINHIFDPPEYIKRLRLRWIGKRIPRADAHWMGGILAQLSPGQIRDAFRAAGYSPEEVEAFSKVVEDRITELENL